MVSKLKEQSFPIQYVKDVFLIIVYTFNEGNLYFPFMEYSILTMLATPSLRKMFPT